MNWNLQHHITVAHLEGQVAARKCLHTQFCVFTTLCTQYCNILGRLYVIEPAQPYICLYGPLLATYTSMPHEKYPVLQALFGTHCRIIWSNHHSQHDALHPSSEGSEGIMICVHRFMWYCPKPFIHYNGAQLQYHTQPIDRYGFLEENNHVFSNAVLPLQRLKLVNTSTILQRANELVSHSGVARGEQCHFTRFCPSNIIVHFHVFLQYPLSISRTHLTTVNTLGKMSSAGPKRVVLFFFSFFWILVSFSTP